MATPHLCRSLGLLRRSCADSCWAVPVGHLCIYRAGVQIYNGGHATPVGRKRCLGEKGNLIRDTLIWYPAMVRRELPGLHPGVGTRHRRARMGRAIWRLRRALRAARAASEFKSGAQRVRGRLVLSGLRDEIGESEPGFVQPHLERKFAVVELVPALRARVERWEHAAQCARADGVGFGPSLVFSD